MSAETEGADVSGSALVLVDDAAEVVSTD